MTITKTPNKVLRAVGYYRVSSTNQVGERHVSLDTQEIRFVEYCESRGYQKATSFTDVASGRREDRPNYQRLLEFVRKGGADVIVVQFLDRFGRNPREILRRVWELEERGVRVEATDEDIREELVLLVRAGLAGAESKRISERVRVNITRRVSVGVKFGIPPYGFRGVRGEPDRQGRVRVERFEHVPTEVVVIRRMFEMAVEENMGAKRIADAFNASGYRTRKGNFWATSSVLQVLYNEANIGRLVYGRRPAKGNEPGEITVVEDVYPPIFTKDEWIVLQRRRTIHRELSKGRSRSSSYLLSGIARCGECGAALAGKVSRSRGRQFRRYVCAARHQSQAKCPTGRTHNVESLDQSVLEFLGRFSDPRIVRKNLISADRKVLNVIEVELATLRRRLEELDAELLRHLDRLDRGVLTEDEYTHISALRRAEVDSLRQQEQTLEDKIKRAQEESDKAVRVPIAIRSFLDDFRVLDVRRQKALLQDIVKSAYVHRDGRIEVEFRG